MTIEERLENSELELKSIKEMLAQSQISIKTKEIRANKIVLDDECDINRITLLIKNDEPQLYMYDKESRPRVMLGVNKSGPSLDLNDEDGKRAISMVILDKVGPCLGITDERGEVRVYLKLDEIGPNLTLCDKSGKMRAYLVVTKAGPALTLYDENGAERAVLSNADKSDPSFLLNDEKGKIIWRAMK